MRSWGVCLVAALAIVWSAGRALAQGAIELSSDQLIVACGSSPERPPAPNAGVLRVRGAQDTYPRGLFGGGELVIVSGGTQEGLALGQRYYVRRPFKFGFAAPRSTADLATAETTGWLRIVAVNATTAVATIDFACSGVMVGDYLEPFEVPASVNTAAATVGDPDFSSLSRVLYGDKERQLGGAGDVMLIDRGSDQGAVSGARFAIYRDLRMPGVPLVAIGEGIVVSAANGRAVMRILSSRGAVESGDFVVPRAAR